MEALMKVINLRSVFSLYILTFLNLTSYSAQPEWTVMVYLCADNNLEPDSIDDVDEMESAFSQVLVLKSLYCGIEQKDILLVMETGKVLDYIK